MVAHSTDGDVELETKNVVFKEVLKYVWTAVDNEIIIFLLSLILFIIIIFVINNGDC